MKRFGRGVLELPKVAEELRDAEIELDFLTGPLQGKHDPAGHGAALFAFFAAVAESERDYIRDKTLEGQETARTKGKAIGGVKVSDGGMLATALRLRDEEELSLREIAARLVIRTGKKRGEHPSAATVMRTLREHDERTARASTSRSATCHFAVDSGVQGRIPVPRQGSPAPMSAGSARTTGTSRSSSAEMTRSAVTSSSAVRTRPVEAVGQSDL